MAEKRCSGRSLLQSEAGERERLHDPIHFDGEPERDIDSPETESPGSKMDISDEDTEGGYPNPIQGAPNTSSNLDVDDDHNSDDTQKRALSPAMSTGRRTSMRTRKVVDYEESAPASPVEDAIEEPVAGPSNAAPRSDEESDSPAPSSKPSLKIKLKVPEAVRQPVKRGGRRGGRGGRGRGKAKDTATITLTIPARSRGVASEGMKPCCSRLFCFNSRM